MVRPAEVGMTAVLVLVVVVKRKMTVGLKTSLKELNVPAKRLLWCFTVSPIAIVGRFQKVDTLMLLLTKSG